MTLGQLETDVLDALGFDAGSASTSSVRVRVRRQLNWAHRQLLATPGLLRKLRDSVGAFTFTSAPMVARYGLPASLGRINSLYDPVGRTSLPSIAIDTIHDCDPGLTPGTPSAYAPLGLWPVRTQPSVTVPGLIVSGSPDPSRTITIEYVTPAGDRETLTATQTLPIQEISPDLATNEITRLYVSTPVTGAAGLTISNGTLASGTAIPLVRIPTGRTSVQYLHVQLWPTPSGAVTYTVDYTREIADLADPTDVPLVPPDFHELLSVGAQLREYRKADDGRTAELRAEWEMGIARLTWWVMNPAQPEALDGPSRLGPWFAPGT